MTRGRWIVLAAVAALLALPGTAGAATKSLWGPNELLDGTSAFPVYQRLGVDELQRQLLWDRVATRRPERPRDPNDPAYAWPADLDAAYAAGRTYRFRLGLLVKGTPGWANGGRAPSWVPDRISDYTDFLVAAAKRYKRVSHWMVWGEPNRSYNWKPLTPNSPEAPRLYSRLLDRSYVALKSVRRSIKVIGGNTVHTSQISAYDFMRWMRLPNGKPPRLDWFGHNAFTGRRPDLEQDVFYPGLRDMSDLDVYIREIRRHWRSRKVKPKLWLSEFCISSDRANYAFNFFVSRAEQAQWLTDAWKITRSHRWIAGLGWYNLQDGPGDNDLTCGLLDKRGDKKPAFDAYRRAR